MVKIKNDICVFGNNAVKKRSAKCLTDKPSKIINHKRYNDNNIRPGIFPNTLMNMSDKFSSFLLSFLFLNNACITNTRQIKGSTANSGASQPARSAVLEAKTGNSLIAGEYTSVKKSIVA